MPADRERHRVFISAKSADYEYARKVHEVLTSAGVPTFFSQASLPDLGSSDYRREIDRALDEVDHMVVVTSQVDHVLASWVEAEWGFFINEKRSGRKRGNLVTIVVGGLKASDLPPSLRYYEVIPFERDGLETLQRYLGEATSRHPRVAENPPGTEPRLALREVATMGGPPQVRLICASPDGRVVAAGGFDGAIRLYDTTTHSRSAVIASARYWTARHEGLITALQFSPDGGLIASGHLDGSLHVFAVEGARELAFVNHELAISAVAYSPDGRLLTASKDGSVKCWDLSRLGEAVPKFGLHRKPAPVVSMTYARGGEWLVTGLVNMVTRRYVIQVQEAAGAQPVLATLGLTDSFVLLAIASDGGWLATGGPDGAVRLYDFDAVAHAIAQEQNPKSVEPAAVLKGHRKPVTSLAFRPNGRQVVSCAMEPQILLWDLAAAKLALRLQGGAGEVFASATPVGRSDRLAAALSDGRVRLWEPA